jgi:hypothetical protein
MKLRIFKTLTCALTVVMFAGVAVRAIAQEKDTKTLKVSTEQISDERLTVYHDFMSDWYYADAPEKYLAIETIPLRQDWSGDPAACMKGMELEAMDAGVVHHFTEADTLKIASKRLQLYDLKAALAKAEQDDESQPGANGHALQREQIKASSMKLLTFSEIQFDKKHEHAILHYTYSCDPDALCLTFNTVILTKSKGVWKTTGECAN